QIQPTRIRSTMADLNVIVYEHLDGTVTIGYGPHTVGRYTASGQPITPAPPRRPTRERHWLSLRPKRSALRAALGFTPADAPLLSRRKTQNKKARRKNSSPSVVSEMNLVMNSGQLVCYKKRPTSRANNMQVSNNRSMVPTWLANRQILSQSIVEVKKLEPAPIPPSTADIGAKTSSNTSSPIGEVRNPIFSNFWLT